MDLICRLTHEVNLRSSIEGAIELLGALEMQARDRHALEVARAVQVAANEICEAALDANIW